MKSKHGIFKRVIAFFAVMVLLASSMAIAAFATAEEVSGAKDGILLVRWCYPDPDNTANLIAQSIGTGFCISEEGYIVTGYHVVHPEVTDDGAEMIQQLERLDRNYKSKIEIRVYYTSGSYDVAKEITVLADSVMDFTVLQLQNSRKMNRKTLKLVEDAQNVLTSSESVFALGFPFDMTHYFSTSPSALQSEDVNSEGGYFSKVDQNYLLHSCTLREGMSGGPLVNEHGDVVGINVFRTDVDQYNYAVPINRLIKNLNDTGYGECYTPSNATTPATDATTAPAGDNAEVTEPVTEPTTVASADKTALNTAISDAKAKAESDYSAESFSKLKDALADAEEIVANNAASQEEVDAAERNIRDAIDALKEKSNTTLLIGIIAAAVILIAIIVIIIVVVSGKKKKEQIADVSTADWGASTMQNNSFSSSGPAPAPSFTPQTSVGGGDAETGVLGGDAMATTVLGAGSADTTVLNSKPYAKLTRKSNGEIIQIGADPFIIGKERRKVNYCIEDNATISRSHAKIVKSGAKVAIVDLGSKNGTFVNGVKCTVNAAVDLNEGDKITLSDEDFTFSSL